MQSQKLFSGGAINQEVAAGTISVEGCTDSGSLMTFLKLIDLQAIYKPKSQIAQYVCGLSKSLNDKYSMLIIQFNEFFAFSRRFQCTLLKHFTHYA